MTITEEPPPGSVVAIDWGGPRQQVWVANRSNLGNWYTTDRPLTGHPTWVDVLRHAEGRTITLLVATDADTYRLGYRAGVDDAGHAVAEVLDELRYSNPQKGSDCG